MSIQILLALALASFVWMVAPGPGVFATMARTLAFGFRSTLPFIAGIVCGDVVYLTFAIFGLAMVANVLGELFVVVRWAGAAYLVYLGIKAWRQQTFSWHAEPARPSGGRAFGTRSFVGGLLVALGNPKVIVFYLSFLPAFVDLAAITAIEILAMGATVLGVLATVLVGYAFAATQFRRLFRTDRAARILSRGAGTMMIGAGCAIAVRN